MKPERGKWKPAAALLLLAGAAYAINLTENFSLGTAQPLDSRSVVASTGDVAAPYEGMLVYSTNDGELYLYISGAWQPVSPEETDPVFTAWDKDYADLINTPTIPTQYTDAMAEAALADELAAKADLTDFQGLETSVAGSSNDWNSAFGWGNHALAGYLTSYTETDPAFTAWDKDYADLINTPTIPTQYTDAMAEAALADELAAKADLTDFQGLETSVAGSSNDWNSAFGWGNHALAGYLTSYTETDPAFTAWDKDYADLINKPTIPTQYTDAMAEAALADELAATDAELSGVQSVLQGEIDLKANVDGSNVADYPQTIAASGFPLVDADFNQTYQYAGIINDRPYFEAVVPFDGTYTLKFDEPSSLPVAGNVWFIHWSSSQLVGLEDETGSTDNSSYLPTKTEWQAGGELSYSVQTESFREKINAKEGGIYPVFNIDLVSYQGGSNVVSTEIELKASLNNDWENAFVYWGDTLLWNDPQYATNSFTDPAMTVYLNDINIHSGRAYKKFQCGNALNYTLTDYIYDAYMQKAVVVPGRINNAGQVYSWMAEDNAHNITWVWRPRQFAGEGLEVNGRNVWWPIQPSMWLSKPPQWTQ